MSEELIDVDVIIDGPTMKELNKMTRKDLIEKICALSAECYVNEKKLEAAGLRCTVAIEDFEKEQKAHDITRSRLTKCESYVEQARGMIDSVTNRWWDYRD